MFDDAEQYDETLLSTDAGPDDDAVRVAAHPREHLQRIGADLPRATLANWMIQAGILIQPLINLLQDRLLSEDVVQMDEMPVQVLKGPARRWCCISTIRDGVPGLLSACCKALISELQGYTSNLATRSASPILICRLPPNWKWPRLIAAIPMGYSRYFNG